MKSLVKELGSEQFKRVKVGIGNEEAKGDLINFVLGRFSSEELIEIEKSTDKAVDAVITIVKDGIVKAMNDYN